ncbi:ABC transporter permease [Paenibacillus oenotherae]|uniref:ABC transporter permease n=1 Tax=Paenibacillus oenotherae TaxID=1435645 RepID=A0ABS7DCF2_9BACL|nr:ABC transporter permease [Paenibacillus oenotherae]MBW7477444.1 ABC transporter permease [Paenibacillus oenotherae]
MHFSQGVRMAWKSILSNKMRTLLTMLGIVIGVSSVITLVAMGRGSSAQVKEQMSSLGTNLLSVTITGRGAVTTLSVDEAEAFGTIDGVIGVSPVVSGNVSAKYATTNQNVAVEGVTASYETVREYAMQSGRFISSIDVEYLQKVAVLGSTTATDLFGTDDPVGQSVSLNGIRYKVVGLLAEKGSSLGGSNDEKILIPISAAQRLLQSKGVRSVYIQAESEEQLDLVQAYVENDLAKKFRETTTNGSSSSYRVFNQADLVDTVASVSSTLAVTLSGIACISLLVGGIGVMNIMLVSVTERTREIGIRKSVGAKRRDIMLQFLLEALVISGWSGAFGVGISYAIGPIVESATGTPILMSWDIILLSFAFSFSIGIIFGIFPASKASRLKPVDALRYD